MSDVLLDYAKSVLPDDAKAFAVMASTVNTAYSAIGYSAKSDIVPILGWSQNSYTNNYRI